MQDISTELLRVKMLKIRHRIYCQSPTRARLELHLIQTRTGGAIKTSDLSDAALNYIVGELEKMDRFGSFDDADQVWRDGDNRWFKPSGDWSQGGPIIERELLVVTPWPYEEDKNVRWQCNRRGRDGCVAFGPTPLIAAMRCYVADKIGDELVLPTHLATKTGGFSS